MLGLSLNTYFHILFIVTIFSSLFCQIVLISEQVSWKTLRQLGFIDGIYGISAIMVVGTGLLNWFLLGKGSSYYLANSFFIIKISLFTIVGLLSIYPTVMISRAKKQNKHSPPANIQLRNVDKMRIFVIAELILMALIPLFAELMANGIDIK
ncbi:DUF2214 family protein [Ekhidna sp.]|uniref:DUF2214 family protein n=1 Tax=Ekhidna sp. TaxID=2608089 RepID=UPI003BAA3512